MNGHTGGEGSTHPMNQNLVNLLLLLNTRTMLILPKSKMLLGIFSFFVFVFFFNLKTCLVEQFFYEVLFTCSLKIHLIRHSNYYD